MSLLTDTFDTAVSDTTVNLGEKRLGVYSASCKMKSVTTVTVTRGYTSKPTTTSSSNLTAKSARYSVGGGTWVPTFEDAEGTIVTQRAYRSNEAGFWELEETTEVRTATITAKNRETGVALTPLT